MIFTKKRVYITKIEVFVLGDGWKDYEDLREAREISHTDLRDLPRAPPPSIEKPLASKNNNLKNLTRWY